MKPVLVLLVALSPTLWGMSADAAQTKAECLRQFNSADDGQDGVYEAEENSDATPTAPDKVDKQAEISKQDYVVACTRGHFENGRQFETNPTPGKS